MKLKITIDEKNYEVDVEVSDAESSGPPSHLYDVESSAARTHVVVPAAPPTATGSVIEEKVCRSPVSGVVANVTAQAGQTLQVGDVLLVLEAMKMETQVTAPVAGRVAAVKVKAGDPVKSGQILVEFE